MKKAGESLFCPMCGEKLVLVGKSYEPDYSYEYFKCKACLVYYRYSVYKRGEQKDLRFLSVDEFKKILREFKKS